MPTSEVCSDGASLMPSPRKPTTWPRCFRPRMMRFFCSGRDPAEQVRLFQPRGERFVAERLDLGAGQHPVDRNAEFAADMLRHALVVAAEDLDADTLDPKRGDGRPRARLWRVEEHRQSRQRPARVRRPPLPPCGRAPASRQATPSARNPSAPSPSKTFAARVRAASSSGSSPGSPGSSYRVASLMTSSGAPLVTSRRRPSCSTSTETRRR